ncbi:DUF3618 domain-containing protein [Mycobacterium sp. 29Ha]|uniref:DUF3618 domain-containing protein n=1 Tax=Mycobacterium sp. 29Ha TaxID=2939268 RepID=UPI0029394CAE|nr:DUF3618 domain-containing protein [Mycobacterium sp. 29Ha]MDV3134939.1 DUF3618 domain-containing protein [Mycobacterium sp. 29Ha]
MAAPDPNRPEPGPDAGIEDIEADVEQTRKELGETVEALADKLNVKARAKEKATETKEQVVERADAVRQTVTDNPNRTVPIAAVAVIGVLAVGFVVWRRRR